MFTLTAETKQGDSITLTDVESDYQVLNIDGLNPPNAVINSNSVAGMDGSKFASSKLEERNIVLTIGINGNVEENRLRLYRYFKTKQYCKIYYANGSKSVYAEGYVETIECALFEINQQMQISIVCQDPYLKDIEEVIYDISQVVGTFEFPFAFGAEGVLNPTTTDEAIEFSVIIKNRVVDVCNAGETETGVIIEMTASGTVVNPTIYCVDTNEKFALNLTLYASDILTINTIAGEKSVTLNHEGDVTNCLKYVERGSSWLKVERGDNLFTYSADEGDDLIQILFKFRTKYEAV